jgi:hypothetical protein
MKSKIRKDSRPLAMAIFSGHVMVAGGPLFSLGSMEL